MAARPTTILTASAATRRAEYVMGTVISLVAPDGGADGRAADDAFAWFHEVDRRFSPFEPNSEVSALIRGELLPSSMSADLAEILDTADIIRSLSGGAFDIRAHRSDGAADPTGLVKGWSVDRAVSTLIEGGVTRFALNAGGDVRAYGGRTERDPWRVGVVAPTDRTSIALVVSGRDLAVATSGTTERGAHIADGRHDGAPVSRAATVTVVGHSLGRADAYATAAFAMAEEATPWLEGLPGYEGVVIREDGSSRQTAGMAAYEASTAA